MRCEEKLIQMRANDSAEVSFLQAERWHGVASAGVGVARTCVFHPMKNESGVSHSRLNTPNSLWHCTRTLGGGVLWKKTTDGSGCRI